jgi:hypothetical protein
MGDKITPDEELKAFALYVMYELGDLFTKQDLSIDDIKSKISDKLVKFKKCRR